MRVKRASGWAARQPSNNRAYNMELLFMGDLSGLV